MRHQRAQFGAEQEQAVAQRPVERLDAKAVAHQVQRACLTVEDGEAEHPDETRDRALDAPFADGRQHDLGVAGAAENVAALFQFAA